MLTDLLPVLVRIDLLSVADVPVQDDDRRDDRDDRTEPLVVPLHIMEEQSDPLAVARSIILAIQKFLRKLLEKFGSLDFAVVQRPNLVVDSWVVFKRYGVKCHVDLEILVARLDRRATHRALLRVLQEELQDTELTETMAALH